MNKNLKMMIVLTLTVLSLTSCACSDGMIAQPTPTPTPITATPMPSPDTSMEPDTGMAPDAGLVPDTGMAPDMTADPSALPDGTEGPTMMGIDAAKLIAELEKLSEVDTAQVAAMDGRALVGLKFDAQYQGTLTGRIEEMAVSAVSGVEEMLTDVAVTADPALVEEIKTLSEEMTTAGDNTAAIKTRFDELYNKIKPDKGAADAAQ